jgi:UDP-glucose 4-epimerase
LKRRLSLDLGDFEAIWHLAANPEVRIGATNPAVHFKENILATYNLLEAAREHSGLRSFVFASTSTVYGEAEKIPTPEDYGPLKPVSTYGASKLACESLISAYASSYGFRAVTFRLANIVGSRSNHGIIFDLVTKLKKDPNELEILGDGTQEKSYLSVKDCVSGMAIGVERSTEQVAYINVGPEDRINVMKIADIVCEEMGLGKVKVKRRRVTQDGRGWIGDVKFMELDVSKLKGFGWRPTMNSEAAVRSAAREVISELEAPSKKASRVI